MITLPKTWKENVFVWPFIKNPNDEEHEFSNLAVSLINEHQQYFLYVQPVKVTKGANAKERTEELDSAYQKLIKSIPSIAGHTKYVRNIDHKKVLSTNDGWRIFKLGDIPTFKQKKD